MQTGVTLHMKGAIIIIINYGIVSPHPAQLPHLKINTLLPATKLQHKKILQCKCTEFQRSIMEQHVYNSSPMRLILSWTHIGVAFSGALGGNMDITDHQRV
jgi:hypothetical protein